MAPLHNVIAMTPPPQQLSKLTSPGKMRVNGNASIVAENYVVVVVVLVEETQSRSESLP